MIRYTLFVGMLLGSSLVAGCTRHYAPSTVAHPVPDVDLSAPRPTSTGRLVLDVTNAPGRARILARSPNTGRPQWLRVCNLTPCVLDLDYGQHQVAFYSHDASVGPEVVTANVGERPSVLRHSFAEDSVSPRSTAGTVIGVIFIGAGSVIGSLTLLGSMFESFCAPSESCSDSDSGRGGLATIVVSSLIAIVVGTIMIAATGERPRASHTEQYELPDAQRPRRVYAY